MSLHRPSYALLLGFALLCGATSAFGYNITNRWTSTKADGGGLSRGDAITVGWSVVPDGESWSRGGPSDLIDYLDVGWGVDQVDRTPDLTNRPWWSWLDRVYSQYTRVSGLTMVYTPEQDAAGVDLGQSGDIRIGGVPFTWENDKGGVLADNAFPNNGDMRIDTYRGSNGVPSFWHTNPAAFRNLIAHESGHGMGLGHSDITGANAVMETPLESNFWGLQFDDIYAFNRNYGDPLEKNGGNDTANDAYDFGALDWDASVMLGADADDSVAQELDDDWLGIDGLSDEDWFRFEIAAAGSVSVGVTPLGPTYSTDIQGDNTDFSARSDLRFEIYGAGRNDISLLASIDFTEAGQAEQITSFPLGDAGAYYVRVEGEVDLNQFYQLDLQVSEVSGVAGDVTQDGLLNEDDINAFVAGWLADTSALGSLERTMLGDLDLSGQTTLSDAWILHQALLEIGSTLDFSLLQSVPEPSAGTSLLLGCLLASARRSRHAVAESQMFAGNLSGGF